MAANSSSVPVYLFTYNCARQVLEPEVLADHLFAALEPSAPLPEILAIGLQEVAPLSYSFLGGSSLNIYLHTWKYAVRWAEDKLALPSGDEADEDWDSPRYTEIARKHVGMTALLIFSSRPKRIRHFSVAEVGFGLWSMANKGAIGVKLNYGGDGIQPMTITIVSAHLAPHEHLCSRRNADWEALVRGLVFEESQSTSTSNDERTPLLHGGTTSSQTSISGIYSPASHFLVMGDLNYRTADTRPTPQSFSLFPQPSMSTNDMNNFFSKDQLTTERKAGRSLQGLTEAEITFAPTYKYKNNSKPYDPGVWDWAPHRWPSWCDRILWLPCSQAETISGGDVEIYKYSSIPQLQFSDHRPVALHAALPHLRQNGKLTSGDLRVTPPFSLDMNWKDKREVAQMKETAVGYVLVLFTTIPGLTLVAATVTGIGFLIWYGIEAWLPG